MAIDNVSWHDAISQLKEMHDYNTPGSAMVWIEVERFGIGVTL